jgi:rSAM/selenodomain-associated transferase 1
MTTVAIAIICKTPAPGRSKTRLSPPLRPEECAAISSCFIRDLSTTIAELATEGAVSGYAVYTPVGSEPALRELLPPGFALLPQIEGGFGDRLLRATQDLLAAGHRGAILVNSDSPTLPREILRRAADAVAAGNNVVLSPAHDGGYTLIGLSQPHRRLFEDIPWSTGEVFALTVQRAKELGVPVVTVPGWYDVDDAESLRVLEDEMAGNRPSFATLEGARAEASRAFLNARRSALAKAVA